MNMTDFESAFIALNTLFMVFGFLVFCFVAVVWFFVCRLLLAVARWFEIKTKMLVDKKSDF